MKILRHRISSRLTTFIVGTTLLVVALLLLKLASNEGWYIHTIAYIGLFLIGVAVVWKETE